MNMNRIIVGYYRKKSIQFCGSCFPVGASGIGGAVRFCSKQNREGRRPCGGGTPEKPGSPRKRGRRPDSEKIPKAKWGVVFLLCCVFIFAACSNKDREIAEKLYDLEAPGQREAGNPEAGERVAELEKDVAALKDAVNERVTITDRLGSYYKLLAVAYIDKQMFGKALEAIEEAIRVHPQQHGLFIYRAISAARLAKALDSGEERAAYMKTAEDSYLRAIALEPASTQALYGLAVLYTYELDQPQNALPLLERILRIESRNVNALFVLGATHYLLGNTEAALETYDRIITMTSAGTRRDEAKRNRERILEEAMR